jgi:hypothetical protein
MAPVAPRLPRIEHEPGVRADSLDPAQKRAVWAHIQANEPKQLAFLTDPRIVAFMARYSGPDPKSYSGATPIPPSAVHVFPKSLVDAALERAKVTTP